jgi:hypothetical protein
MREAYLFLREDMTSGRADDPPWEVGEKRRARADYASVSWYDALMMSPNRIAAIFEVPDKPSTWLDVIKGANSVRLVATRDATKELQWFACECADRSLQREQDRDLPWKPYRDSWQAVKVARAFLEGKATREDLDAGRLPATEAEEMAWRTAVLADAALGETNWISAIFAATHAVSVAANSAFTCVATDSAANALVAAFYAARHADRVAAAAFPAISAMNVSMRAQKARQRRYLVELLAILTVGGGSNIPDVPFPEMRYEAAAAETARATEEAWQRQRLAKLLAPLFVNYG